jgi:hypothetical protein
VRSLATKPTTSGITKMMIEITDDIVPQEAWEALCKIFNRFELADIMNTARERKINAVFIVRGAVLDDIAR